MSNPTTPFSWQMPTATDLVTDLPADFEVFGQAVATSMADLLGGTTGQILAKNSATDMDFVWIANDQGDITGITATAPLTGGGSSGAVTVGIQDALTTQKGAVQLSDSTSTTSSILAATPTAVKSAYDLADGAIAKTTVTTAGDIIYRNATVPVRLGIGTANQVLRVNSGATAPEWATPASGGGLTVIATGTLSGTSVVIGSIPGTYKHLMISVYGATWDSANDTMQIRYNSVTTNYTISAYGHTSTTATNSGTVSGNGWDLNEGAADWLRTGGANHANWTIYDYNATTGIPNASGTVGFQNSASIYAKGNSAFSNQATSAAITSVTIRLNAGRNMTAGTYTVYGVS